MPKQVFMVLLGKSKILIVFFIFVCLTRCIFWNHFRITLSGVSLNGKPAVPFLHEVVSSHVEVINCYIFAEYVKLTEHHPQ